MIPKEVTDALNNIESNYGCESYLVDDATPWFKTIKNYLETSDRYMRDLEQHVDDLAASYGGTSD